MFKTLSYKKRNFLGWFFKCDVTLPHPHYFPGRSYNLCVSHITALRVLKGQKFTKTISSVLINSNGNRAQLLNWLEYQLSTLSFPPPISIDETMQHCLTDSVSEAFQLGVDFCHTVAEAMAINESLIANRAVIDDARKVKIQRLLASSTNPPSHRE